MTAATHDNTRWPAATPALSVLIPFLRDDPSELLAALDGQADAASGGAEVILLDDGTADPALSRRLEAQLDALSLPARLITLPANQGRARGRNRLAAAARGRHLLFLDSDMRPDHPGFLTTWLDMARTDAAVAFGGFSLEQAPVDARCAVHRAMAARSDCVPAARRALQPEKHVFTSNLLVRRDVFDAETFDPAFTGWGWEDVEWAMRVSRRFEVRHIDNTATHMGLDDVGTLIAKYRQAAPNFARVAALHPDFVAAYPSYRLARRLKGLPGLGLFAALLAAAARPAVLPVRLRAFLLRLYRASLYAEAL